MIREIDDKVEQLLELKENCFVKKTDEVSVTCKTLGINSAELKGALKTKVETNRKMIEFSKFLATIKIDEIDEIRFFIPQKPSLFLAKTST